MRWMRRISLFERHPAVASSLLVGDIVVSHTNLAGADRPNLHPALRELIDSLSTDESQGFDGRCAESALLSDQLWRLDAERKDGRVTTIAEAVPHFEGAVMTSRMIRPEGGPDHGKPTQPCAICASLLEALHVRFVG
ncbi:YwqJ-related putative deaminase [Streptomyces longispororuber]|uniref:YwqJ-related putative deaminase n=1 Tax=Streptomyces longispororuber TaxID=68230 RepID=UPI003702AC18